MYIVCGSRGALSHVGFDRSGPGGKPGRRRAGALFAAHEQMVDFRLLHDASASGAAPSRRQEALMPAVDRGGLASDSADFGIGGSEGRIFF
jgi:hypothetical protein